MRAVTVAIAGAAYPNTRGPTRRFGIELCRPGDLIELRREPKNPVDPQAIAIYEAGGIQLGYVPADKAQWFRSMMSRGVQLIAIFQNAAPGGDMIRVGIDHHPALPPVTEAPAPIDDEWPVDPIWDDD